MRPKKHKKAKLTAMQAQKQGGAYSQTQSDSLPPLTGNSYEDLNAIGFNGRHNLLSTFKPPS